MGPQWMLLLTLSTCWRGLAGVGGRSAKDGTDHQDTLLDIGVRLVTPSTPILLTTDEGQNRELVPHESNDGCEINTSLKYLTDLAAVPTWAVKTLSSKVIKNKSIKMPKKQNTRNDSKVSTSVASMNQVLGAVVKRELRGCSDAGDSRVAALLDLLPHPHPRQVMPLPMISVCRDYLLLDSPGPLPTDTTSYYQDSLDYPGRKVDQSQTLTDLVSYLISLTSGRQFYLVYDDVIPGVEGVVRSFQEVLGDTILLSYDPNILLLTEALRSNYHVQAMRNIFILCSTTHLANIFKQVRNKRLESPTIQWFIIVDEDLTEDLPGLLREGTQVALVQRLTPHTAKLFSSRVDPDGQIRFHRVGSWSLSGTLRTDNHQVKGGLVPDLQQLYSDFQGRQLVFTSVDNWPYFKIKSLENGTVIPISGVDFSVVNTLSEKLNFTYRMVRPLDDTWGGPQPDHSVTGMVGQVARREAHASICELTITRSRETVVDFTVPYYLESTALVTLAPKEKNRSFAVFSPFTVMVWLCICLVTVLMGPLLYLVTRLLVLSMGEEDTAHYSLQSFSFNMYRNLVVQGNLITSHRWSLRFIFLSWYLFCFYVYALYSGTLTAVLAIPAFEKPIDSLHDLAQAHRDGYTIGTVRDTTFEVAFKEAKSGIYHEVWQLFNHKDRDQSFLPSPETGFEKLPKQKYAFIVGQLNSKLKATQRGREKFYIGRQTFLPQSFGIACNSGAPYKDVFSSILVRLTEAGLVYRWAHDEINKASQNNSPSDDSGFTAINLQHLQAAFFILLLGFAISTIVLGMDIMASSWWQSHKNSTNRRGCDSDR